MPVLVRAAASPIFTVPRVGTPSRKGTSSRAAGSPDGSHGAPAAPGGSDVVPDAPDGGLPGLVMSWTGGLALDQVLSAAARYGRHRAGENLPAWGEAGCAREDLPAWNGSGCAGGDAGARVGEPMVGPQADELGEEAMMAAIEDRGRVLPAAALGGHAIMT